MNFKDGINFANENPVAWLATSEDNQPHVRTMLMKQVVIFNQHYERIC